MSKSFGIRKSPFFSDFDESITDRPTDGRTNRPTDKTSYRDADASKKQSVNVLYIKKEIVPINSFQCFYFPLRELHAMSVQLRRTYGKNEVNKKMLQEAFSLLAYADPWNSPVGAQLDPARRETICSALNSAILGKDPSIAYRTSGPNTLSVAIHDSIVQRSTPIKD